MIWYLRCGLHALGRGVPCPTNRRGSIHHEGSCWPAPPIPRADPVLQYQPLGYGGQRSVGTATSCCARPHCSIRRGTHPPSTWRCTGPLCSTGTSAQSTCPSWCPSQTWSPSAPQGCWRSEPVTHTRMHTRAERREVAHKQRAPKRSGAALEMTYADAGLGGGEGERDGGQRPRASARMLARLHLRMGRGRAHGGPRCRSSTASQRCSSRRGPFGSERTACCGTRHTHKHKVGHAHPTDALI
jgi:hypothetical protein